MIALSARHRSQNSSNKIHPNIPLCDVAPENNPKIFDGMVILQHLPPNQTKFREVLDCLLAKIINGISRVPFFTTDYYFNQSVKAIERKRRSAFGTIRNKVMRKEQVTQKEWKKFMRNADNKTDLIEFLLRDWSTNEHYIPVLEGKDIYLTIQDQAYLIQESRNLIL